MKILKGYQFLSVLVSNLFLISGCSEFSTPPTVQPRQIQDYKGDKLLLCSGHNLKDPNGDNYSYWKRNNYKSNDEWYTVNIGTHEKPDCVADLTKKETYDYLGQKEFDTVIDEYCVSEVSHELRKYASRLIKDHGLLLSKLRGNFEDSPKIKAELIKSGFKDVIFSDFTNDKEDNVYWAKNVTKNEIIQVFKNTEAKVPSKPKCETGYWYYFLAIK